MLYDLECKTGFRPKLKLSLSGFGLLSALLCAYTVGSSYLAVSGYGDWAIPGQELVSWLSLLGMIIMCVAVFGLLFSKVRCAAMALLVGSGMMVLLSILALKSADTIRMQGFERLSKETVPLIAAINDYHEEFGQPPESLKLLKVTYPPGHEIKGGDLPDFTYIPGGRAVERYHGNPWVLVLEAPTGPLRWDKFVYYPLQNYPSLGNGGWFERVGKWAYIHE
jgi:hypothetical protein